MLLRDKHYKVNRKITKDQIRILLFLTMTALGRAYFYIKTRFKAK